MVLEIFPPPTRESISSHRYDDVPASFDFSSNISYPPTHDSEPVDLVDPIVVRPYKGYSVGYDRFGRRDFEFKFSELPNRNFSRWGMTIKYNEKEGNSLDISRFDTTIKFFINETAYVKLEPHSRSGIAMDASNTVAVLAWLPERAFRKVKSDGLVVYQLTQPGSTYVLRQEKILLPGKEKIWRRMNYIQQMIDFLRHSQKPGMN
jgi:hypothetical protein